MYGTGELASTTRQWILQIHLFTQVPVNEKSTIEVRRIRQ